MLLDFEYSIPDWLRRAGSGVTPQSMRRAIENRVRPRMTALARSTLPTVMLYPDLGPYFEVRQQSIGDTLTFSLVNTHRASVILQRGGTIPHTIEQDPHWVPRFKLEMWAAGSTFTVASEEWLAGFAQVQIARRGVVIEHPGTQEDRPMWDAIDSFVDTYPALIRESLDEWLEKKGMM